MEVTLLEWGLLVLAGYLAGVLNAIAGGGSFLTFPALVWVGVPPVTANATSAVAVLPGYLGGAAGFRRELETLSRREHVRMSAVGLAGGLLGGGLLLVTPGEVFSQIVPLLLLFATLMFAFGQTLLERFRKSAHPMPLLPGLFVVAVYGGYFNGGLGIMLLAMFAAAGMSNMLLMNGLKNWVSFIISLISVIAFAIAGKVMWAEALVMMVAATAGGYQGAALARKLPVLWVKRFVIATGLVMALIFLLKSG
ncbi:sulfite exporter TauE/SafE family protein [Marinobacterium sp. AK62]|uniref:Probable membrane transporter protein n=1 Tax=Marinobacterium alkalitolerans TaxID=1542925 RepID=A0ABS3ZDJ7_9GAMM|nr:sulfite exporter TauE/SafE family protein [Marinobacterium alkalitolerans]MBP0049395.1 sulfite exporter TauE/SafE family protein [Marinobacterium alkalitolerans]